MWSIGCIFAQILKRKTILQGDNTKHQLECIFDLIGTPEKEDIEHVQNEKWRDWLNKVKHREARDFEVFFPDCSPEALDLLKQLLIFNPAVFHCSTAGLTRTTCVLAKSGIVRARIHAILRLL